MAFLILGILLLAMKLAEFGPVATWSWWVVLAPFGLAVVWWAIADGIGLTQRRAMDKMEKTKTERRDRNLHALGLGPARDRKARHAQRAAAEPGQRSAQDASAADGAARR